MSAPSPARVPAASGIDPNGFFETVDCPFCASPRARPITGPICDGPSHNVEEPYRSMSFRMWRCDGCSFIYQRERLKSVHLTAFYAPETYHCYKSFSERGLIIRRLAMLSARKVVRVIERLRPRENEIFVDFGCGNGSWLELFRMCKAPWDLHGTEISDVNVGHIRKLGFKGHTCDHTNIDEFFKPGSVGVIFLHHVIEHVPSPLELFRSFHKVLSPGGIIIGQTPNSDCLELRVFGDHWGQWHVPQHLTLFDTRTMTAHARKAGLNVISLKSSPSGATQWAGSILKYAAARQKRVYRWTHEPLHPILTLLFAPLSVLQTWLHNTSHMDFIVQKPAS